MPLKLRPTGLGSGIDKDRAEPTTPSTPSEWEVGRRPAAVPIVCAGSGR